MIEISYKKGQANKGRSALDLKLFASLITLLDGYRVNYFEDFKWVDEAVKAGKLGRRFRGQWKDIQRTLYKMAAIPRSLSHVSRLVTIQQYIVFLGAIFSTIVMSLFMIAILGYRVIGQSIQPILVYISIPAFVGMLIAFIARPLISHKVSLEIDKYCEMHPTKFGILRLEAKRIAQILINLFSDYLRQLKKNPEEHKIELYNIDYDGIEVIKKPGRLRKHYTVILRLKKDKKGSPRI